MTPVVKVVLALGALCFALVIGTSFVSSRRARTHYNHLMYAARNGMPEQVVAEYHRLPGKFRAEPLVKAYYVEAKEKVGDNIRFDVLPTFESSDAIALGVFVTGMLVLWLWAVPGKQKLYTRDNPIVPPDVPTEGQLAFIRRINNGIVPVGLTKAAAASMIKAHLTKLSSMSKRQRVDISPLEFMSGSKTRREQMRVERERKRAQEKLARQQEQERRRLAREEQRAQKAADRLYDKRIAEEEKLRKAREEKLEGIAHRTRSPKAMAIQELQNLVNDILEDKKIEAQEVRQLKAWLIANKQAPEDFAQMLKIIDDSLVDGIIDAEETQAIYEGVIDCLITLRERR
ncbi:MAG: hypothetical protein IKQ17_03575 [Kiritimatiellae bacterium]|nr:hypothetical protein [Kiritimatiellia bacterium]